MTSGEYNLINFGYHPWNAYWKRNQTIFHFASKEKYIRRALYVNPGVYASTYLSRPSLLRDESHRTRLRAVVPKRLNEKIRVYTPLVLPGKGRSEYVRRMNDAILHAIFGEYMDRPRSCS
jgi:hypothetical protein